MENENRNPETDEQAAGQGIQTQPQQSSQMHQNTQEQAGQFYGTQQAGQGQPQQYYGAPQGIPGQSQPQQYYGAPQGIAGQGQPQQYYGAPQGIPGQGQPQQYYGAPQGIPGQGQPQQYYGMPQGRQPRFSGSQPQQPFPQAKAGVTGPGARVGYFCLAWVPMVACIVLQVVCLLALVVPAMVIAMIENGAALKTADAIMIYYYHAVMKMASPGVFFYHIVGIIVFGLWYYLGFKKPRPKVLKSFRKLSVKNVAIAVIAGIGLCFFANGTVAVEAVLLPGLVEDYMQMAETAGLGTDILVIFASIILAPIGEELLCRGVILKYAKKSLPWFWMANCLQALLFGIIHMNWVQGIYAFVIGLVLGWLVERYQSILPAIILHFVVNLSSSTWIGYVLAPLPATLPVGVILIVASSIVVIGVLLWGGRRPAENGQAIMP